MLPDELMGFPAAAALENWDPSVIVEGRFDHEELTLWIAPQKIVEVCRFLKEQGRFTRLSGVTAVDWFPADPQFEVVYHLHSLERNLRLRLKCRLSGEAPELDSVALVWRSANWYEREVFDLFGVVFRQHPNLRRILLPENWVGHPLRKDYPVHGYKYSYGEPGGG
jgi:NADH-quinone oxidoreductase subunit C